MPTRNRRRFMVQTLKLFEQQDYAQKELIVIDDGDDPVVDLIPADARIRYVRVPERMSIGAKRNLAVSIARGDLICHWDDDDFFGCHRLSRQVEPILKGKAECSGMRMSLLLRTADATLWGCTDQEHDRLFGHGVRCGTLLYPASYWREGLCYEDRNCEGQALPRWWTREAMSACGIARISPTISPECTRPTGGKSSFRTTFQRKIGCFMRGWHDLQRAERAGDNAAFLTVVRERR
jgi:hypothetical protein